MYAKEHPWNVQLNRTARALEWCNGPTKTNDTEEFINAIVLEENFTYRNSVYVKSKASKEDNSGT